MEDKHSSTSAMVTQICLISTYINTEDTCIIRTPSQDSSQDMDLKYIPVSHFIESGLVSLA